MLSNKIKLFVMLAAVAAAALVTHYVMTDLVIKAEPGATLLYSFVSAFIYAALFTFTAAIIYALKQARKEKAHK